MPRSPRGRPTLLSPDIDELVQEYVRNLRTAGCVVNSSIIIAGATGIIQHKDSKLLSANGGNVELTKDWAKSLMKRMGLSKRKGKKGVKTLPSDFDEIQNAYVSRVKGIVDSHDIQESLIINWDQTGVNLVPCGNWTMEEKGSKQVPLKGADDKLQITVLLGITKSGNMLPQQVIYPGLTDKCHPKFDFPKGWDICHTQSHWSTDETMIQYVQNVIIPYVDYVREEENLPLRQKALCIFDVFAAHRCKEMLHLLDRNNIKVVYVPGACTDRLQPLDLIPNNIFKTYLKAEFQSFYAAEIEKQLSSSVEIENVNIDLRTSYIKAIHAKWLVTSANKLKERPDVISEAFSKAGI